VIATVGEVQVLRVGDKTWQKLSEGQLLGQDDALRTAADARVEISVDEVKVRIHEDSEFKIQQVEKNVLRAQATGRIEGDLPEGKGGIIEIKGKGSNAVVRTGGGRFSMTADGRGIVAVAAVRGTVNLATKQGEVTLSEGKQSRVYGDSAPQKPSKMLSRVLLKVDWPDRETRLKVVPIAGKVSPGSRVTVQGRRAQVDAEGNFTVEVPLAQGKQRVAVTAVDVMGRKSVAEARVLRDDKMSLGVRERPAWSD
jgi:hypothetical protein